jgi:glycosyltransferase involved in cell wall biosynthesis
VNKINILMITGVYLPEMNGAVLQCNQLIKNLGDTVNFTILTSTNKELAKGSEYINGVKVYRVFMPKDNKIIYMLGVYQFYIFLIQSLKKVNLIHLHGFSKRNALVILIGFIYRKKIILKMTSYGHDDPLSIKNKSSILWLIFKLCTAYIGIAPEFHKSYKKTKLKENKYNFIPNGVDLDRFNKLNPNKKNEMKRKFGFSEEDKIIIFVGHFSIEKRPMLLYKAWVKICEIDLSTKLLFIGKKNNYFEVDEKIFKFIQQDSIARGINLSIYFLEDVTNIDEYMKISDVFVLPSIREGLPNVLLEAMSCSLPCIVSNIPGITDWLINDGLNGFLFDEDENILAKKIIYCVSNSRARHSIGLSARHFVERNFSSTLTAQSVLELYVKTLGQKLR